MNYNISEVLKVTYFRFINIKLTFLLFCEQFNIKIEILNLWVMYTK